MIRKIHLSLRHNSSGSSYHEACVTNNLYIMSSRHGENGGALLETKGSTFDTPHVLGRFILRNMHYQLTCKIKKG
jgi:hypothetical protein